MSKSQESYIAENGITLGIAILALFVIFGVGLPRWLADDAEAAHAGGSTSSIQLPDSLSGGFKPADQASSWKGLTMNGKELPKEQATQYRNDAVDLVGKRSKDTSKALGLAASSRIYINKKLQTVVVSAQRGSSDAWFAGNGGEYSKVGDATCYTTQSQAGPQSLCRKSSSNLSVQVQAPSNNQAVDIIDDVWSDIA